MSSRNLLGLVMIVVVMGSLGCSSKCQRHSDCASGLICGVEGACVTPPDASPLDGAVDAGDGGVDAGDGGVDAGDGGVDAGDGGVDAGDGGVDAGDASPLDASGDASTADASGYPDA